MIDLKFAKIFRKKEIDRELIGYFKKAYLLNKKIFKKEPKKFRIFICDSEKEFKKKSKGYYNKWATAIVFNNLDMVTRSPDFMEHIGRWKRKDFQNIINHEMNHVFYISLNGSWKPIWLSEGIACYVGHNFILKKSNLAKLIKEYHIDYRLLEHRYLVRKAKFGHYPRYPVWANFVKYLISKYSLKKLITFIAEYSKKPDRVSYHRQFEKEFGLGERKLFEKFIILNSKD